MEIKNTENHFGFVAIILHWFMGVLVIGLLCLGLYMADLPSGLEKLKFVVWHKEFGLLVLFLVCFRFLWRVININPSLAGLPWYEKLAARVVHGALYVFMFAMPLTGWLMSSAAGHTPSFFGLFDMPNLVGPNKALAGLFNEIHQYLAYTLIGLITLHTLGALKHHFIDRNNIFRRMLP